MMYVVQRVVIIAGATSLVAACSGGDPTSYEAAIHQEITYGDMPLAGNSSEVLFDGRSWDWTIRDGTTSAWIVHTDGSVEASGADAVTREEFGDFQLHLEFLCPVMTDTQGQARANSGVYLHGRYEVQVLDSYGQEPALNGCGAVYSIAMPNENASLPPGQWQTYDIVFRAPRYDHAGTVIELPRVTVIHNGILIHDDLELPGTTPGGLDREMLAAGPILLQFHGDPVRYRNIRVRSLN
jgi:hypothetical protein